MAAFDPFPGPLDGVKLTVDKLLEEDIETVNLSDLGDEFDFNEYRQRDDVDVERVTREDGGEKYRVVPHSDEARELLDPETYSEPSSEGQNSDLSDSKPEPNPDNGGDNIMAREPNDPDDLGRQTRDARGSEFDMFDNLEDFQNYLEDRLGDGEDEVEVTVEDTKDVIRYLENEVISESLEVQEDNYDRVSAFVDQVLQPTVDEHYDSLTDLVEDAREFRDEGDYDQVRRELGTMERRGQDFEDEYDLDL
ncbi:hypothetical protein GKQ38_05120 [Candidatus Nanohaloarchaea archaeon]|nr:hypothetical protein GKQ38_05120 [Candidatus Nanohaloarchaea archaeon]